VGLEVEEVTVVRVAAGFVLSILLALRVQRGEIDRLVVRGVVDEAEHLVAPVLRDEGERQALELLVELGDGGGGPCWQVVGGGGGASPDGLHQPPERSCERLGGTVARECGGDHEVDEHAARGGQRVLGEGGAGRGGARSDRERDVEEGRLVEGDGLVDLTLRCSWLHSPLPPSRSGGRRRTPPPAAPRAWTPSALAKLGRA